MYTSVFQQTVTAILNPRTINMGALCDSKTRLMHKSFPPIYAFPRTKTSTTTAEFAYPGTNLCHAAST